MHVLICEDDPLLASELEAIISEFGAKPLGPAATRDEAIALAADTRPDVALIDLHLRDGHTGPAIAEALSGHGIRLVVLSGDNAVDPKLATIDHMFLTKPVRPAMLLAVLESVARDAADPIEKVA